MNFSEKLIQLRRKNGWSQEELAERLDVSRQAVTKWESGQSLPELNKIIRLSELFDVSLDFLLKDNFSAPDSANATPSLRRVSMEEAQEFLAARAKQAKPLAVAVMMSVMSAVPLMIAAGLTATPRFAAAENVTVSLGMIFTLLIVAAAVAVFISVGSRSSQFDYIRESSFEPSLGVRELAEERRSAFKGRHACADIVGAVLCILSVVPIFIGTAVFNGNDSIIVFSVAATLLTAGVGAAAFVWSGVIRSSFDALLQQGDYTAEKKAKAPAANAFAAAYWLIATAVFLGYSFTSGKWNLSWIIFAVAGVLYPAITAIFNMFYKKDTHSAKPLDKRENL